MQPMAMFGRFFRLRLWFSSRKLAIRQPWWLIHFPCRVPVRRDRLVSGDVGRKSPGPPQPGPTERQQGWDSFKMTSNLAVQNCRRDGSLFWRAFKTFAIVAALVPLLSGARILAGQGPEKIVELNSEFHFLGPQDSLLLHEENGKLKGQIDIFGGEEESDAILSYLITIGSRDKNHVEFKTSKVHQKYYRFSGNVERGTGRKDGDPDYVRLVGEVQIISVNGTTGNETTERRQVVLKSLGMEEIQD